MPRVIFGHVWDMPGVISGHVSGMYMFGTCLGHVWDMCWICFGQVSDMFRTSFGQHLGQVLGNIWAIFRTCFFAKVLLNYFRQPCIQKRKKDMRRQSLSMDS